MKANELMLGDWVYGLYPNGDRYHRPFRISAVDTYPNNRSPRIVTEGGYGFQEEYLEPIPLTPEILEKNGFTQYGSDELFFECEVPVFTPEPCTVLVTLQNKDPEYDEYSASIQISAGPDGSFSGRNDDVVYVHELQHALRLCGIDKIIEL